MWALFKTAKRCSELEDDVRQLKSELKSLQLEWESVYDSLRRLAGKIARRQQHDAQAAAEAAGAQPELDGINAASNPDQMSARIRASRHGLRGAS